MIGFSAWPNDEETGLSRELSSGSQARQEEVRHRGCSAMDPCQEFSVEVEFWRSTLLMFCVCVSPFCFFLLWLPLLILKIFVNPYSVLGFPGSSGGKESACNAGDPGSIPGLGRSPGGGHGNPLQYSCLENPMDRGAWRAAVHRVARNSSSRSFKFSVWD